MRYGEKCLERERDFVIWVSAGRRLDLLLSCRVLYGFCLCVSFQKLSVRGPFPATAPLYY